MRRLFWVAVGATAGVYAVRKVQKTVAAYSPSAIADRAADRADGFVASALGFVEEVRLRMGEREQDLRAALGLADDPPLTPAEAAELTDRPVAGRRPRSARGGG